LNQKILLVLFFWLKRYSQL